MTDKLEGESLVSCLRQLVLNCDPLIRDAGSVEQAEEALAHIEENDENFHKYEFVKSLRTKLDTDLGALIDEEIELHAMGRQDAGYEDLVDRITEKVVGSREYAKLSKNIKTNVNLALDQLVANYEQEFGSRRPEPVSRGARAQRTFSFSDVDSSFSSSFNQGSFMFMNQEQLLLLTDSLDRKRGPEARREALCNLLQMPAVDVQTGEYWASLKRGLLDALADTDEGLAGLALRFVAKGFASSSPNTREMYTTLVDHLENQFTSKRSSIPKIRSGLDLKRPEFARIMKGFRLISEFQHQIPQYWVRYSEKFLEDILDRTLSLFSFHYKLPPDDVRLTPVHFAGIFDPRAGWFTKWMHGNYSRTPMIRLLQKYKALLTEAMKSCLRFMDAVTGASPRRQSGSEMDIERDGSEGDLVYSPAQLDYIHFVHSFSILSRLICYTNGRLLFPLIGKEKEAPVTISKFLITAITFATNRANKKPHKKSPLEPSALITDAVKRMASLDAVCAACLCNEEIIKALLVPFQTLLNKKTKDQGITEGQEFILLQIADILSNMASTKEGRKYLLHGSKGKGSSSAAETLAELVQRALSGHLRFPTTVLVALVYICRQFYSTAQGLEVLRPFQLHLVLAEAWREAVAQGERADTPTERHSGTSKENLTLLHWEETLRDNLLNFAGTPRGLLLLQQTGAINDCVQYMFTRYVKKLQVSKCEKFGYGLMLTQVAATAAGMSALLSSGFVRTLVHDVWASVETSADDRPLYSPRPWPVEAIDKISHKPFINILNILSSYSAVYELIGGFELTNKQEYSFREIPDSLPALIDRIIVINSDEKIHSLFHYEQSHIFGLRILSVMISSLDTFLLLQTQYGFQEVLLKNQLANITDDDSNRIIIDALSIERNYILVKSYATGGPSERLLPPRTIQDQLPQPYPYPMVSKYPIPDTFLPSIQPSKQAVRLDNPLSTFLTDSKSSTLGPEWLEDCRRAFVEGFHKENAHEIKTSDLAAVFERGVMALAAIKDRSIFPTCSPNVGEATLKKMKLSSFEELGIEVTLRYGQRLGLCGQSDAKSKLTDLIKSVRILINQQTTAVKSDLKFLSGEYKGFDWFVASLFLVFDGDRERCWRVLLALFPLPDSVYLWPQRMHHSSALSESLRSCGIPPLFYKTCHYAELILSQELPQVHSAFRMSGYPPAQLCQHWLLQCLWNYLDWPGPALWMCLCTLCGPDYHVYLCVALIRHLEKEILHHLQLQDVVIYLKEEPIRNFKLADHLAYMQSLEEKYRDTVLPDMMDINRL